MRVVAPEDSGNAADIVVTGPDTFRFAVRSDTSQPGAATSAFRQWFWVQLQDVAPGRAVTATLVGASGTSYAKGWDGYRAVASDDGAQWIRVDTVRAGDDLVMTWVPQGPRTELAYFAPYPHARREALLVGLRDRVDVRDLGPTPDGLELPLITLGTGPAPVWIVGRQHPGETMAEWFVEGLVRRLVGGDDAVRALLAAATVRIVPCVNPDGARRGNHRTNALGMDLNRAWAAPDAAQAPEVAAIRAEMDRTGVSFGLDVHGDEEIPYVFPTGGRGTPSWDAARAQRLDRFLATWMAHTPHLQTVHGYPPSAPGEANLSVCSNQLTERYRCVAITLEQPFLDHNDDPDAVTGWSPDRSAALGASVVEALVEIVS